MLTMVSEARKARLLAEQYYKREAIVSEGNRAGEERSDERAWILSDNISGSKRVMEQNDRAL